MTAAMFAGSGYKGKHIGGGYYLGTTLTKVDDVFSVVVKEGTTEIASGALDGVTKLTFIYVPASVTTLTQSDFTAIENLNMIFGSEKRLVTSGNRSYGFKCTADGIIYTTSSDKATVWGYIGESSTVSIPSTIEGKIVSRIEYKQTHEYGSKASTEAKFGFAGRSDITAITVASALKNGDFMIDGNVFGNMSSLTTINLSFEVGAQMYFGYGMIYGSGNVKEVKFQGKLAGSRIRVVGENIEHVNISYDSSANDNLLSDLSKYQDFEFALVRVDGLTA